MGQRSADRPLVVGFSSNVVDPTLHGGRLDGIGVYTDALQRALRSVGVETRRIGAPFFSGRGLKMPQNADTRLRMPLVPSMAWSALTGRAAPLWHEAERAIDIYHATDYRVPKLRRTPVVATLYDAIPLMRPDWGNPRLRALKNWLLRAGAANADRVIAISSAAVEDVVRCYRVQRDRVRVVHLGVGDEWFDEPPARAREAVRRFDGLRSGFLLFVGTLQPRKNLALLIQAYDRLESAIKAEHQLVIVGKYGWGVEDLRRVLEARRADKQILWLEYVERDVLRALYRDAAAFVFPSLAEGFGLPMLEAFASGLPVVASDIPSLREVAGGCAILTSPVDVDAVADAMTQALGAARSECAARARRERARSFDWRNCAAQTLDVYRELA